ncbi:MAG: TonB-dependent siderophore receptor [Phormidesmis sp. RL_2_1]|nr:TonB-dependent siderophore receptor [Phormidesmis sp. RL_2_1]
MNLRVSPRRLYGKQFFNLLAKTLLGAFLCISGVETLNAKAGWANEPIIEQTDGLTSEQLEPAKADDWLAQIVQTSLQEITNVQVAETETGFELILETAGTLPEPVTSTTGNALIIEIPNAVLVLPEGEQFQQFSPSEGIALVQVSNVSGDSVEIAITGADAPPTASVSTTEVGFALSVTPGIEAASTDRESLQIVVTGEQDEGYNPSDATTATRTETPLRDIPQSIQVVPQQVIEDQGITRIGDALRNVSGVTPQRDRSNASDRFSIRGFDTSRILRNGFRTGVGLGDATGVSPNTIERVEILKGPASVLYGQVEPGGVVNYVTKRPLDVPFYNFQLRAGSFGLIEPAIDIAGPLTEDRRLTYRLNASYQDSDSFRDFVDSQTISIAPVISYDFSDQTNLTFEYEYREQNQTYDDGLPIDPIVFELPRGRFLGEPDDFFDTSVNRFNLTLDHRFNDNIRLRSGFAAELFDSSERTFRLFEFDPESNEISRFISDGGFSNNNLSWQTDLISEFNTGSIEHQLLAGFEWVQTETIDNSDGFFSGDNPLTISVIDPQYGTPRPDLNTTFSANDRINTLGFYLQDQITLLPNLKLLLGGRYDFATNESEFEELFEGEFFAESSEFSSEAFSPRLGLVYQPIEPISLYGSFSRSFIPNNVTTVDGNIIEPERGTQYEVGVRGEFDNLSVNLAAYNITKTNLTRTDPDNIDFSIPIGEVRSRGIELDVAGEPIQGWNIIGSLFFNDAAISEGDENNPEDDILINAPGSGASLWTTYEIQSGDLQGLGFGAGLFYVGDREAQIPNDFVLPSYVRGDASIFYKRDDWQFQVNFQNLFDTNYFESAQNTSLIFPGTPFTVVGRVSFQF